MSEHTPRAVERHCDVAVISGSASALAAATVLGRQGRSVIVVDESQVDETRADDAVRADHDSRVHGHDQGDSRSTAPAVLNAGVREEVRSYGGEILVGQPIRVSRIDGELFRVELPGGHAVVARRVLADPGEADGGQAGAALEASLAAEDDSVPPRPSANQADWDHRYGGDPLWSGNPNGTLVNEVRGLVPGRALDVGAGEGADALWLTEQGWSVTATDVSQRALARVQAEAQRRGVTIECRQADANQPGGFEPEAFDLVSAQYAAIPRSPDCRGVANLVNAVAPGGTLLVVSHDPEAMRPKFDPGQPRMFDPDAYVRVEDFKAALANSPDWDIELQEKRPRPPGAVSASHHVDDVVLRARRRPR
ncbi:MAG: class I SAM-dependent methyltransferase [Acidimicrobiales bacterium]